MSNRSKSSAAALILAATLASPVQAEPRFDVEVVALFEGKAILRVDGHRRVMANGETSPEGLTLVSSNTDEAVIDAGGGPETLYLGMVAAPRSDSSESVSLYSDARGFFHANGKINGRSVKFLVDTGANTVALSSTMARQLGIDYKSGQPGVATTASGVVRMYGVFINELEVEGMQLKNVEAGVLEGVHPNPPLLGMSALRHFDMTRSGSRMELEKP